MIFKILGPQSVKIDISNFVCWLILVHTSMMPTSQRHMSNQQHTSFTIHCMPNDTSDRSIIWVVPEW